MELILFDNCFRFSPFDTLSPMPDERLDRIIESLHQINISLEGLRITLSGLEEMNLDQEERLRKVETWKHNMNPLVVGITFALGAVISTTIARVLAS